MHMQNDKCIGICSVLLDSQSSVSREAKTKSIKSGSGDWGTDCILMLADSKTLQNGTPGNNVNR